MNTLFPCFFLVPTAALTRMSLVGEGGKGGISAMSSYFACGSRVCNKMKMKRESKIIKLREMGKKEVNSLRPNSKSLTKKKRD